LNEYGTRAELFVGLQWYDVRNFSSYEEFRTFLHELIQPIQRVLLQHDNNTTSTDTNSNSTTPTPTNTDQTTPTLSIPPNQLEPDHDQASRPFHPITPQQQYDMLSSTSNPAFHPSLRYLAEWCGVDYEKLSSRDLPPSEFIDLLLEVKSVSATYPTEAECRLRAVVWSNTVTRYTAQDRSKTTSRYINQHLQSIGRAGPYPRLISPQQCYHWVEESKDRERDKRPTLPMDDDTCSCGRQECLDVGYHQCRGCKGSHRTIVAYRKCLREHQLALPHTNAISKTFFVDAKE